MLSWRFWSGKRLNDFSTASESKDLVGSHKQAKNTDSLRKEVANTGCKKKKHS